MKTHRIIGALALAALGLLACDNSKDALKGTSSSGVDPAVQGQPLGATNAQGSGANAPFVDRLSTARCDREESCGNVAPGKTYASRAVCMDQMHGSIANDLNSYNCPRGIDAQQVGQCIAAIAAEECGHPIDTLSRMEKCRTSPMCLK